MNPSTPASFAMVAAVNGLSPVHIMVLIPIARAFKTFYHTGFYRIFQIDNAQDPVVFTYGKGNSSKLESYRPLHEGRMEPVHPSSDILLNCFRVAPLRIFFPLGRSTPLIESSNNSMNVNLPLPRYCPPSGGQVPVWIFLFWGSHNASW